MANHKDEHVIYIKDMLFAVLYKWRTVLIVAVAAALLLGGFRFVSLQGRNIDSQAVQELTEDYLLQKEALEKEIVGLEERIEAYDAYIDNSPFIALNPHSIYAHELHIYLEPLYTEALPGEKYSDPADPLLGAYRKLLVNNETFNTFAAALGLEGMNMEGIVDVNCDYTTNQLTIIVRQADQEKKDIITEVLQTAINDVRDAVTQIIGEHKMSVINTSVSLRNDTDLALLQTRRSEELLKLEETLKARTAELDALAAPDVQPVTGAQVLVSAIKYAIVGGLLGFFGVACILVLVHLARKKVYSGRTLEDQTGLAVLGCIPGSKKRSGIDLWLRKLEGRSTESSEHMCALIAARIRNLCGDEGALLLSGAAGVDDRLSMLNALEAAGCKIIANGDLLRNIDTANALTGATCVVLFEQCGKSLYTSVGEAAAQAEAMGKPVLGCVLIDG